MQVGRTGGLAHWECTYAPKERKRNSLISFTFFWQKAVALHNLGIFPNAFSIFLKFTTCSMKQHTLSKRRITLCSGEAEDVCKYRTGSLFFWFQGLAILKQCSHLTGCNISNSHWDLAPAGKGWNYPQSPGGMQILLPCDDRGKMIAPPWKPVLLHGVVCLRNLHLRA